MAIRIFVPRDATACALGADEVAEFIRKGAEGRGLEVEVIRNGSRGAAWLEPLVEVETDSGRLAFGPVAAGDVPGLFEAGFPGEADHVLSLGSVDEIPWLARQQRLTFARAGLGDPLSLENYKSLDGFKGLERALALEPQAIVDEIKESGLRGRGGAAFPTGIKWQTVLDARSDTGNKQKYIVCNADEGDSGTFADRLLMESDPYQLIEGMTIAGLAVGATEGFIYLRSEYPHCAKVLKEAISRAEQAAYLGDDICGAGKVFRIDLRIAAGAYICGEETSLLDSLEGKRGMVRFKPPLPAIKGLMGLPTVVNNVLSLAAVSTILAEGAAHYRDFGSGRSRGTLTVQLAGNIKRGGLVELPFGATLRELVEDFGGGTASGRPAGAIQVGGPLGTYLPASQWDVALDYEALAEVGGMLGHGGIVVFDDTVDMAQQARFAFAYATHKDRITRPMIRENIDDPWREVSWDEAFRYTADRLRSIQREHGKDSIGGITSSRCTNEETFLVQKMIRAAFGNNNVDTCARVCHSPTGYGLKAALGESAGTQAFNSVAHADVVMVMGANPSDAHPVFASRLKHRLRQGAKLIVVDPRKIELVDAPHVRADHHLAVRPGGNVAFINAMAHVVVTEGLEASDFIAQRCEDDAYRHWREFISNEENSPEVTERTTGIPASELRAAARLFATAPNAAIYYGLGVSEHSQGSTAVMGIANLAMVTGNLGREGVGVNPLRGQNNVQGSCDMGSFPHELPGYRHVSDAAVRSLFENEWNVQLHSEPGLRIPNMFDAAISGHFKGLYVQGEDLAQSDPNTQHVEHALKSLECLIVQDIFLNETARFAHVFLPGSSFLEKNGTFTNAERRISMVRKAIEPLAGMEDWEVTMALSNALDYPMNYSHPSEIMDEIARLTPTFTGVSYEKLDRLGSIQWPCNEDAPEGTPTMHVGEFVRGKGYFAITGFVPTGERTTRRFPLLLTTGRVLSQYNVGAQTRRTANSEFYSEDVLEIHPFDAGERGISQDDWCGVSSRAGNTVLRAAINGRMQAGVVFTTFHFPSSGANVVTTDNSDWATNCPEYKVTAVQVSHVSQPSQWQKEYRVFARRQEELLDKARTRVRNHAGN